MNARKFFATTIVVAALSCWCFAQSGAKKGNISITSGPTVNAQSTSATIHWTTSGNAATFVKYGTDQNNLSESKHGASGKDHDVTLSGLQNAKTYFYAIMNNDGSVRQQGQFSTNGSSTASSGSSTDNDANNPNGNITITSGPNVTPSPNSATITWTTSGNAANIIHYSTDANNLSQRHYQPGGSKDHSITLSNLQPGTTYYYAIMTDDATVRQQGQFTTTGTSTASTSSATTPTVASVNITAAPILQTLAPTYAVIQWTTDAVSSSQVRYGTAEFGFGRFANGAGGSGTHSVQLSGLQPNTTYYFEAYSNPAGSSTGAHSGKKSFKTPPAGSQAQNNVPPSPAQ